MYKILQQDAALLPFQKDIELRMENFKRMRSRLTHNGRLIDFANAHEYFGFHRTDEGWVYREWAPAADAVYLTGEFNGWSMTDTPMTRVDNGNWELFLPADALHDEEQISYVE